MDLLEIETNLDFGELEEKEREEMNIVKLNVFAQLSDIPAPDFFKMEVDQFRDFIKDADSIPSKWERKRKIEKELQSDIDDVFGMLDYVKVSLSSDKLSIFWFYFIDREDIAKSEVAPLTKYLWKRAKNYFPVNLSILWLAKTPISKVKFDTFDYDNYLKEKK